MLGDSVVRTSEVKWRKRVAMRAVRMSEAKWMSWVS